MKKLLRAFIYSCILALLTVVSVSLFWKQPVQPTLVLIVISAVMLLVWRSKEDLYLYAVVSISGALAEAVAMISGAWVYPLPAIVGVPIWLPFVWGIAGVFIKKISLEIHDFLK